MGKKRKNEDFNEEKILRKIRKLENKLKNRKDREHESLQEAVQDTVVVDDEVLQDDFGPHLGDQETIYLPPSDWGGTVSPVDGMTQQPSHVNVPEPQTNGCSSPQPGPSSGSTASSTIGDETLDDSILNILGDAPKPDTNFGNNIHKDVASRWQEILLKGLSKETKDKLIKEYLIPANCELLVPPILNPEAKAALPEALVRRDFSLLSKQKHLAAAITALAHVTDMLICNNYTKEQLLKPISDAGHLLCDSHNLETKTRRNFVTSSINATLKGALTDTIRDKYLFGENLTDKLNAAKSIQRSGDTLKGQIKTQANKNNFNVRDRSRNRLNSRALHPKTAGKTDAGQVRSGPRVPLVRMQPPPPPRRPRSSPPPPRHSAHRAHYSRR